jgi:hypothetical protein
MALVEEEHQRSHPSLVLLLEDVSSVYLVCRYRTVVIAGFIRIATKTILGDARTSTNTRSSITVFLMMEYTGAY